MAESKKTDTKAETKAPLAWASESTDPAVHQVLAERQTAVLNGDLAAEEAATQRLAELGYR